MTTKPTPTKEFWNYFNPLCKGVEGVVYTMLSDGDRMERLLADSRTENTYPGVFCLRPKYRLTDNGADQVLGWFDVTFLVFVHCSRLGNYEAEDAAFDEAERIALEIYTQLRADEGEQILFEDNKPINLEPVSWTSIDAAYGYEAKVRFALPVNSVLYE